MPAIPSRMRHPDLHRVLSASTAAWPRRPDLGPGRMRDHPGVLASLQQGSCDG